MIARSLRLLVASAIVVLAVTAARAQQATVSGTVTDEAGQPVVGVKLVLEPAGAGGLRTWSETKKKGNFLFGIVRPGAYQLKVELEGKIFLNMKARAVDTDKKESWAINGRPNPKAPPMLSFDDGMDVTIDLVVGPEPAGAETAGGAAPPAVESEIDLILERVRAGDCAGALPALDALLEKSPDLARGHYLKGFCLAMGERREEAVDSLGKALELNPKFEGAALQRGELLAQLGRFPEAEASLQQEIGIAENAEVKASALVALGQVQAAEGKDAEAIATFEQVLAAAPTRSEPYTELGSLYAKTGQVDKAKAILDQGRAAGAMSSTALLNLAISYWNRKDFAAARESLEQVLAMPEAPKADLGFAQAILGKILLRDGKTDPAVAAFKASLELAPEGPLAAETREMLKALKK